MIHRRSSELNTVRPVIGRLEVAITALLAMASSYYTWLGLTAIEASNDWFHKSGAVIFAVAMGAGLYFFWRTALAYVPLLVGRRQLCSLAIVVIGAFMVVGISSFFNLSGMIGDEVLNRHLRSELEALSKAFTEARNSAERGLENAGILQQYSNKFADLEAAERRAQGPSGQRGPGPVSGTLNQIAQAFQSANAAAGQVKENVNALTEQAHQRLAAMEVILDTPGPIADKVARFIGEAERVRVALLDMSTVDVAQIIRQALASARETVAPVSGRSGGAQQRQRAEAISNVNNLLGEIDGRITKELDAKTKQPPLLAEPVKVPTVYSAVLDHALDFIPALLAAIFVDLLPAAALAFKMVAGYQLQADSSDARLTTAAYTVADLIAVKHVLAELDGARDLHPPASPPDAMATPPFPPNGAGPNPLVSHTTQSNADAGSPP